MRTVLLLILLLLCVQIGAAPIVLGCDRISAAGSCSDGCQDEQDSDAEDQCGSCAYCRVNESLARRVLLEPPSVPDVFAVVPVLRAAPSLRPADIFHPPRTA